MTKNRRYKKYRKRKSQVSTLSTKSKSPFPASFKCSHRYVESFSLNPSIGTPDVAYYNATGMSDPTTAIGGHQPLLFDTMAAVYDHYTVLGARAKITFFSGADSATTGQAMVYCYLNDDSSAVLTYDTVLEQDRGVVKPLNAIAGGGSTIIVKNFSTKQFFGVKDVVDVDKLKGSIATNPADSAYFVIGAQGVDSASAPAEIRCTIQIDYITIWSEKRDIAQS